MSSPLCRRIVVHPSAQIDPRAVLEFVGCSSSSAAESAVPLAECTCSPDAAPVITIGESVKVAANCEIRSTGAPIVIGKNSVLEEECVIETDAGDGDAVRIGAGVEIGIRAQLESACVVADGCRLGAYSVLRKGCELRGEASVVVARTRLPEGLVQKEKSLFSCNDQQMLVVTALTF